MKNQTLNELLFDNKTTTDPDQWFSTLFIPDNETNLESILKERHDQEFKDQLKQLYPILAVFTILLAFASCYLFVLLTLWERYGMDPMKRGIKNRVSQNLSFKRMVLKKLKIDFRSCQALQNFVS